MKASKSLVKIIFALLVSYSLMTTVIIVNTYQNKSSKSNTSDLSSKLIQKQLNENTIPYLSFPVKIFDKNGYGFGEGSENDQYKWMIVHGEADTVTEPTTIISLSQESFSNQVTELPTPAPDSKLFKNDITDILRDRKKEQINKYDSLARRFIIPDSKSVPCTAGNEFISSIIEADVDTDGKKEQIIEFYTVGANPWDTRSLIVKDNKIIFTAGCNANFPNIIPSKSGNGFYLEWGDNFKKRLGHVRTRFIWQDGKFIPIFEQIVRYVKVGTK